MRLPISSSPPPASRVPTERSSLLHPDWPQWKRVRPGFWRKNSAPAAMQHQASDFVHFPPFETARSLRRTSQRIENLPREARADVAQHLADAEDAAEAGCFRLAVRALKWWAWHRWR